MNRPAVAAKTTARSPKPRKTRDLELEAGSHAHYEDAAYYTKTYARRIEDVAYYVGLAQSARGPVLEYGIGNGRIALPIARHGIEVVGIDHSPSMLADLRSRLYAEPDAVRARVRGVRGDMRKARLGQRFDLVLATFNTVLHLYDRADVEAFLARVAEHLTPRGRFVVDLSVPSVADLGRLSSRGYSAPRFRHPTTRSMVKNREYFDYDSMRQVLFVSMEFEPVDEPSAAWATPLAHRQFYPQEFEALLHYNGFDVDRVDGDFAGGPLTRTSDTMIWHTRPRRSAKKPTKKPGKKRR